ncbi:MAG TPA: hypothetical protein VGN16_08565 [Acidobacteriaceae bacterium]|jgi:antitoxin ChpS
MAFATARKIGDSMVLELSPELERELDLKEGAQVEIQEVAHSLKIRRPGSSLEELLAQCDYSIPRDDEEREWIDAPRVGRELI